MFMIRDKQFKFIWSEVDPRSSRPGDGWNFVPGAEIWPRFVRSGNWTAAVEAAHFLLVRSG